MQVPTVHIKHPDLPDGALINAADFDPTVHELFAAPAPAKAVEPAKGKKSAPAGPA